MEHPSAVTPPYQLKFLQAILEQAGKAVTLLDSAVAPLSLSSDNLRRILLNRPTSGVVFDAVLGAGFKVRELAELCASYSSAALYLGGSESEIAENRSTAQAPFTRVAGIDMDIELSPFLIGREVDEGRLPLPRYSRWEMGRYNHIYPLKIAARARYGHILASRGCPHRCGYCTPAVRATGGFRLRTRPPESVVEEIKLRRKEGANVALFGDDDLSASRDFLIELTERLAGQREKTPFIAHARVDELDEGLIKRLSRAGCAMLLFGVESAMPSVLRTLKKCRDPEGWAERAEAVFGWCRKAAIRTNAMFIIGSPGESAADIAGSLRLARRLSPDVMQVHFFTPYPGNRVFSQSGNERMFHSLSHYEDVEGGYSRLSAGALREWRRRFYKTLYSTPEWRRKQMAELPLFALMNPDVAIKLIRGALR
ncbi:MAG: hypothetical protein Kow0090_15230 [Myxococcota bacterium]